MRPQPRIPSTFYGFLVGMAIGGLGFGMYIAVDLALVADVLPDEDQFAKDLGVLNIAGALPFSIAPAFLAIGSRSYGALYAIVGVSAIIRGFRRLARKGGPMTTASTMLPRPSFLLGAGIRRAGPPRLP